MPPDEKPHVNEANERIKVTVLQEKSYRSEEQPTEVPTKINAPGRSVALHLPKEAGDRELPEIRLTAAERRFLGWSLVGLGTVLSDEELIFLAGGPEDVAWRERATEKPSD